MNTAFSTRISAVAVAASLAGCTSTFATTSPSTRPLPTDLQFGRLSERTAFEGGNTERDDGALHDEGGSPEGDREKEQRRRKGLFLGGVIASAVGGAGAIAFGAAGQITENQLNDAYAEGLTRDEETTLQDRGQTMNGIAIGSAAIAVLGLGLTAVVLGVDFTHCGQLIKKRRKECEQRAAQ